MLLDEECPIMQKCSHALLARCPRHHLFVPTVRGLALWGQTTARPWPRKFARASPACPTELQTAVLSLCGNTGEISILPCLPLGGRKRDKEEVVTAVNKPCLKVRRVAVAAMPPYFCLSPKLVIAILNFFSWLVISFLSSRSEFLYSTLFNKFGDDSYIRCYERLALSFTIPYRTSFEMASSTKRKIDTECIGCFKKSALFFNS